MALDALIRECHHRSFVTTPTNNTFLSYHQNKTEFISPETGAPPLETETIYQDSPSHLTTNLQDFFRKCFLKQKMSSPIDCALELMRRLPPQNTEENLSQLMEIVPLLQDELLDAIDQPLKVQRCKQTGKDYLVSEFNRDGDACRSPWSNQYDPPFDGTVPSSKMRKLELAANEAFDTYRELYYEGGVSSAYFWEPEQKSPNNEVFSGAVLFKKATDGDGRKSQGAWDSIHVFQATERGRNAHYKLTSTIMLYTITNKSELGNLNLSGNMTRQSETDYPFEDSQAHIANIGRIIEDMELKMRNLLQEVYFGKTRDIVNGLRSVNSLIESKKKAKIQQELVGKLQERGSS